MSTKIEWCKNPDGTPGEVWNPTTGCTKVSEGCKNCYAESISKRFWGGRKFTDVQCHLERLDIPTHWKKPRRVFVDSMSDLFHEDVPDEFIVTVWSRMCVLSQHTFMILTKRPRRMSLIIPALLQTAPNIWLGVSVENQRAAQDRIPWLLATPAAVHFLSVEPILERIDLSSVLLFDGDTLGKSLFDRGNGSQIDWVIAGCESGQKARPSPAYIDVRYLKDQCVEAGVPFFLKQMWGKKMPELDGRQWLEFPVAGEKR